MLLADLAGQGDLHEGHRLWPHIEGWAAELGLAGPDVIARASQPPRGLDPGQERASGQPDSTAELADGTPGPEGTPEQEAFYPGCLRDSPQIRPAPEPEPEAGL